MVTAGTRRISDGGPGTTHGVEASLRWAALSGPSIDRSEMQMDPTEATGNPEGLVRRYVRSTSVLRTLPLMLRPAPRLQGDRILFADFVPRVRGSRSSRSLWPKTKRKLQVVLPWTIRSPRRSKSLGSHQKGPCPAHRLDRIDGRRHPSQRCHLIRHPPVAPEIARERALRSQCPRSSAASPQSLVHQSIM